MILDFTNVASFLCGRMGRKKQAAALKEKTQPYRTVNGSVTARNLRTTDLDGVIFGCTHKTIKECYTEQLFG